MRRGIVTSANMNWKIKNAKRRFFHDPRAGFALRRVPSEGLALRRVLWSGLGLRMVLSA